jgi:hypothetical protein
MTIKQQLQSGCCILAWFAGMLFYFTLICCANSLGTLFIAFLAEVTCLCGILHNFRAGGFWGQS